ncbi:MAG: hypothetical protein ABSE81_04850 [Candidatus Omnitrophota bacterium]
MDKNLMLRIVKRLPFNTKKTVYKEDDVEIQLFHPPSFLNALEVMLLRRIKYG